MKCSLKIDKFLKLEPDPAFARRARIIFKNLEIRGKEKILDLGCGRGFYLKVLSSCWPNLELYGVDLNQNYLAFARKILKAKPIKLIKADTINLPFSNNFFDRIIASEILEHLKDDRRAISELYRVLKPGGTIMITVPNKNYPFLWDPLSWILEKTFNWHIPSNIWWLAGIWADHLRLYNLNNLQNKLKKAGFKIEKNWQITHYCFPFSHFLFYGIGKNLVEKGLFSSFNRFANQPKQSLFNQIFLWPIRRIDQLDQKRNNSRFSVNLIIKARKRK